MTDLKDLLWLFVLFVLDEPRWAVVGFVLSIGLFVTLYTKQTTKETQK